MPSVRIPDTIYDYGMHPWVNNVNDRVDYQRVFNTGTLEQRKIAQAMISQSPLTPREEIQTNMTVQGVPPRTGYNDQEFTIDDVLSGYDNKTISEWNNFSGSNGEINSTLRPNGMWW